MTVYAIHTTGKDAPRIRKFRDEREAFNSGNGYVLVKNAIDLTERKVITDKHLVKLYEKMCGKECEWTCRYDVAWEILKSAEELDFDLGYTPPQDKSGGGKKGKKKSAKKARMAEEEGTAEGQSYEHTGKRLKPDVRAKDQGQEEGDSQGMEDGEAEGKPAKKASKKKAAGKKQPSTKRLDGKKVWPTEETELANPHKQPSSANYISIEIVRDNPGILFEEYLEKGGAVRSLKVALRKGRVTLSDT